MVIDTAQAILLIVLLILTVLLIVLGFQVFLILKELRKTITKTNKVLDDTGSITESVSVPITAISTLIAGIKTGASFAKILRGEKKQKDDDKDDS